MVYFRNKFFIDLQPLFFPNQFYVVIAYKCTVELHDYQHAVIWKLQSDSLVVSLKGCMDEDNKFFIAYKNGNIKIFDILNFSVSDAMDLETSLKNVFILKNGILIAQDDGIYMYSNFDKRFKTLIIKKQLKNIAFSAETELLVMAERNEIFVKKLSGQIERRTFMNQWKRERKFTCIACHPSNDSIATGDTTGQVIVWRNILTDFNKMSILHWHFLELSCIAFNWQGTHLLTGGKEGVIVKWELSVYDSDTSRRFYPRLESEIKGIVPCHCDNGEYYLVTLADNSYHILTSNLDRVNSYYNFLQRSQFLHEKISKISCLSPVGLQSGRNLPGQWRYSVMANGHEGKLQFFDLLSNEVHYQLDVAGQNWPTETENDYVPGFIQVQRVALSHCGRYLATYEQLGVLTNVYDRMSTLKFYHWTSDDERFTRQSLIPMDCYDKICDMIFHPSKNDHLLMITRSSKLFLLSRINHGEHICWDIVNVIDLAEVLHNHKTCLSHSIRHNNAIMSTVVCTHNDSDGILAIAINSALTLYLWSHLISMKTQPLISKMVRTMARVLSMDKKSKKRVVPDIVSITIASNDSKMNMYRIACGLHNGLLIVEVTISKDGSVAMVGKSLALGEKDGSCVVASYPGNGLTVAAMFKNNNKLSIFDIWDESKINYLSVPPFDHITWTKVKKEGHGEDMWVVVGMSKKGHLIELVTCENPPSDESLSSVRPFDFIGAGVNLLSGLPDVEMVEEVPKKRMCQSIVADNKKIKSLTLYESLDMTVALNSLYRY